MTRLDIEIKIERIDINKTERIKLPVQSLRFDKDNNLVAMLSHTKAIRLRNNLNKIISENKLKVINQKNGTEKRN
jgi:hypothetical protein